MILIFSDCTTSWCAFFVVVGAFSPTLPEQFERYELNLANWQPNKSIPNKNTSSIRMFVFASEQNSGDRICVYTIPRASVAYQSAQIEKFIGTQRYNYNACMIY